MLLRSKSVCVAVAFVPLKTKPPDVVPEMPESKVLNVTRVLVVLPVIITAAFIEVLDVCKRIPVLTVLNSRLPVIVANAAVERLLMPVFKPILLFVASKVNRSVSNATLPAIAVTSFVRDKLLYVALPEARIANLEPVLALNVLPNLVKVCPI